MNFTRMSFDKNWNNHADFPTHESQEAKVRADMQYLYDSIKDQFNNFLENELFAANIPYNPTAGIQAENVQAAIDAVHAEIVDIVDLSVADGSITDAKLKQDSTGETSAVVEDAIRNGAVSTNKIQDGAVMRAKISNGAIDESKLADNSVYNRHIHADAVNTTQLVNGAVTTDKIYLGAVTDEKLASNSVITVKIKDANVTTAKIADANVTEAKIASNAVTTAKIKDANVTTAKIADANVTEAKLASNAVTTAKIKDLNVTTGKLAAGAVTLEKTTGIQKVHSTTTTSLASGSTSWTKTGITGVTASNTVICTPAPASFAQWVDNRVRCTAQGSGSLTFTADTATSAAITVNILIMDK